MTGKHKMSSKEELVWTTANNEYQLNSQVKPGTQKSGTRHNKFLKKNKEHFRMRVKNIHVQTLSETSYSNKEGSIENEREDRLLPRNISPLKQDAQSHHQNNKDPSNLNEFD